MFDQIDAAYYLRRAEQAREHAAMMLDPTAAEVHLQFAKTYEAKARQLGGKPDPKGA